MKAHDLPQGSDQWHAHRRVHFNSSDAAAMLGCSPYKTRTVLLQELATGIYADVDPFEQKLFDEGHRTEALARPLAEGIVGEDLYPVVGTEGKLSASFDGLTMSEETGFEHKMLNADLRACMVEGATGADLPLFYQVQMEQQCMVSGAKRVLFMASSWSAAGVLEESRHCWYAPNADLAARIRGGWTQLEVELADWVPPALAAPVAVGAVIDALPALVVSVEGRVVNSNLIVFRHAATQFLAKIKTELLTDQDFADADRTVTFCGDAEKRLDLVKAQALSQTASIDELFRTIDAIREEVRQKRLTLEKLVTARKASIRTEIAAAGQTELDAHLAKMNQRLGAAWIPRPFSPFADAIKGKKTIAGCKEAVAVALANAKIDLSAVADRLDANRKSLVIDGRDWFFLFADFGHVGNAPEETFSAVAAQRIQRQVAAEKEEADRKAAALVAQAPVAAPAPAPAPVTVAAPAGQVRSLFTAPLAGPSNARPPITTGELCERLGFTVTAAFVQRLGTVPAPTPDRKSGIWWHEADFTAICNALVLHIGRVHAKHAEAQAA